MTLEANEVWQEGGFTITRRVGQQAGLDQTAFSVYEAGHEWPDGSPKSVVSVTLWWESGNVTESTWIAAAHPNARPALEKAHELAQRERTEINLRSGR